MDDVGRTLQPGPTDGTAETRVPSRALRLIPPAARRSFVPFDPVQPALRAGENDLTRRAPGRPQATGEVIQIVGFVTNQTGRPLRSTLLEIWNANTWGRYAHVDDPAREPLDPHFVGHGRTLTDDRGSYEFATILPGSYLARPDIGRWRPRHIHFSIRGGAVRLVTQMYFPGDPWNELDPSFILLGEAQQRHIGQEAPGPQGHAPEQGVRQFRFDIIIGGANATYFEEEHADLP